MDIYLLLIALGADLPFFIKNKEIRKQEEPELPAIDFTLLGSLTAEKVSAHQPVSSGLTCVSHIPVSNAG
jgi:hypothetical protein